MQYAVARYSIEASVGERESLGVTAHCSPFESHRGQVRPCEFHVARSQVHSGRPRSRRSETHEIDALPAPDIKYIQAMSFGVSEFLVHPRCVLTPSTIKGLEVRTRARLAARDHLSTRISRPLLDRRLFVVHAVSH